MSFDLLLRPCVIKEVVWPLMKLNAMARETVTTTVAFKTLFIYSIGQRILNSKVFEPMNSIREII